jgi:uncharacterized protein
VTASAIYEGIVCHRRLEPIERRFRYRVWMPLLDLAELPEVLNPHPLWSARRPAPVRVREADFLDAGDRPLAEAARELVARRCGASPQGPVRLLASPRFLGLGYNPVGFLYLHGDDDGPPEALIAEVTNTPWGERHRYVARRSPGDAGLRARFAKRLHVSPYMGMDQVYELEASDPGEWLRVRIANEEDGRDVFEAVLVLRRRELTRRQMSRLIWAYPPATLATLARIYWQGLILRLKGAPQHRHPATGR